MSQFAKPTGFFGKILAKGMGRGHKEFYKNALKAINPKKDDKYLEIGFGSGIFIKKHMATSRSYPASPLTDTRNTAHNKY